MVLEVPSWVMTWLRCAIRNLDAHAHARRASGTRICV